MKKISSLFFMMLTVLILASCNGGNTQSNSSEGTTASNETTTNANVTTASVKEAATELANEIEKVGSPLDVIGYDMSNINPELKSYTMMSYNSDGSSSTDEEGWEDYKVPEWKKNWNDGGTDQFSGKMAPMIQQAYEYAILSKNRILSCNNPYTYIWNEQTNGSKTRITFTGNILTLEEFNSNGDFGKEYNKVYVEKDSENKLFFELLNILEDGSYNYCNYYEDRNYDYNCNGDLFTIDLTNEYPVMIFYMGGNNVNFELSTDIIMMSQIISDDNSFNSLADQTDIVLNNNYKVSISKNWSNSKYYVILPINDKVVESIKVKKEKNQNDVYVIKESIINFKNGEKLYTTNYYGYSEISFDINSFDDVKSLLEKYGYITKDDNIDFSVLKPSVLGKEYEDLTIEYIYSSLLERMPEMKEYSEYGKDLENAEELKRPFEMDVDYKLTGKAKINMTTIETKEGFEEVAGSIDLSNVVLTVNGVEIKNLDYKFNMELIFGFKVYYKGKLIHTAKNTISGNTAIMENPGIIELNEIMLKLFNKKKYKEMTDSIKIEIYGVGASIEVEIE